MIGGPVAISILGYLTVTSAISNPPTSTGEPYVYTVEFQTFQFLYFYAMPMMLAVVVLLILEVCFFWLADAIRNRRARYEQAS